MSLYQPENPGVSIKPEWLMRELSRVAEMLNIATAGGTIPPGGTVDNVLSVAPSQFSTGTDTLYWRDINAEFLSQTNIPKDGKTYGTYWDGNSWEWIQSSSRWDATANGGINANYTRVGIGNDTPNTGLDILLGGGFYYTAPGSAGIWMGVWDGATGWIQGWHTNNGVGGASGVNNLALSATSGIDQLYLKTDGNVGIGTSGPGSKLHVSSALGTVGNIQSTNVSSQALLQFTVSGDSGYKAWGADGGGIVGYTNGAERLRINSSGNVGIGTASPEAKMHLHDGSASDVRLYLTHTTSGVNVNTDGAIFAFIGSELYVTNREAGPTRFWNNGAETLYLSSINKVGIGTSSPSEKLHVVGNELLGGNLKFSGSRTIHTDSNNNKLVIAGGLNPAWSTSAYMQIFGEGDATSPGVISLLPSQSGGVGIGTNTPGQKLDVVGAVRARKADGAEEGNIALQPGTTSNTTGYIEWRKGGAANTRLGYMGWSTTDVRLTLQNSANFVVSGGDITIT